MYIYSNKIIFEIWINLNVIQGRIPYVPPCLVPFYYPQLSSNFLSFIRPIYIGKNQNPKNLVFLLYRLHCQKKPITFRVFGTKSACAKKPESHTDVLVSGAHARLLSTFDRTRVVHAHYVAGRGRVIPMKVMYHVTKNRIIPARLERAFTLAKNQWNFGGVSKNHAAEVGFSIRVFWSV